MNLTIDPNTWSRVGAGALEVVDPVTFLFRDGRSRDWQLFSYTDQARLADRRVRVSFEAADRKH